MKEEETSDTDQHEEEHRRKRPRHSKDHHHNPPSSSSSPADCQEPAVVTLAISGLPALPANIIDPPAPRAKVSVRLRIKDFKKAQEYITKDIEVLFRGHLPNLTVLLDTPTVGEFSGTTVNAVMFGKVKSAKKDEIWFNVGGLITRFSKKEFTLISGLIIFPRYTPAQLKAKTDNKKFFLKCFPQGNKKKRVTCAEIEMKLTEMKPQLNNHATRYKYLKLFVLLLLSRFIFGTGEVGVPIEMFGIVDDLHFCNNFDWGTKAWSELYKYLVQDLSKKKPNSKGDVQYELHGNAWIFQAWICEAVPRLGELVGTRNKDKVLPRLAAWKWNTARVSHQTVLNCLDDQGLYVHPTLCPTVTETETGYFRSYQSRGVHEMAVEDPVIDALATVLDHNVKLYKQLPQGIAPPPQGGEVPPPPLQVHSPITDVPPPLSSPLDLPLPPAQMAVPPKETVFTNETMRSMFEEFEKRQNQRDLQELKRQEERDHKIACQQQSILVKQELILLKLDELLVARHEQNDPARGEPKEGNGIVNAFGNDLQWLNSCESREKCNLLEPNNIPSTSRQVANGRPVKLSADADTNINSGRIDQNCCSHSPRYIEGEPSR